MYWSRNKAPHPALKHDISCLLEYPRLYFQDGTGSNPYSTLQLKRKNKESKRSETNSKGYIASITKHLSCTCSCPIFLEGQWHSVYKAVKFTKLRRNQRFRLSMVGRGKDSMVAPRQIEKFQYLPKVMVMEPWSRCPYLAFCSFVGTQGGYALWVPGSHWSMGCEWQWHVSLADWFI